MEPMASGAEAIKGRSRWSQALKWAARLLFVAAVGAGIYVWRSENRSVETISPITPGPLQVDWAAEPFVEWNSAEAGVSVRHPARYDAVRGFGRFTSRELAGGLGETDLVAFRCSAPRSVIVIATYQAPRTLSWAEWVALAKEDAASQAAGTSQHLPAFSTVFGGSDREYRAMTVDGRPVLAVAGRGAIRYPVRGNEGWELWRFESRFVASGAAGVRITAGVHSDHYEAALPAIERVLDSFRWRPAR